MNTTFDAVQKVALGKAISTKAVDAAKAEIAQSSVTNVNFLVRVSGTVKKGEDGTSESWSKCKFDLLAGVALSNVNEITRNKIIREYVELVAENDSADEKEDALAAANKIKADAEAQIKGIQGQVIVPRTGTVTAKLTAELVEEADLEEMLKSGVASNPETAVAVN